MPGASHKYRSVIVNCDAMIAVYLQRAHRRPAATIRRCPVTRYRWRHLCIAWTNVWETWKVCLLFWPNLICPIECYHAIRTWRKRKQHRTDFSDETALFRATHCFWQGWASSVFLVLSVRSREIMTHVLPAILVYLSYKNAYEDWKEQRNAVLQTAKQVDFQTDLVVSVNVSEYLMPLRKECD